MRLPFLFTKGPFFSFETCIWPVPAGGKSSSLLAFSFVCVLHITQTGIFPFGHLPMTRQFFWCTYRNFVSTLRALICFYISVRAHVRAHVRSHVR